MTEAEFSAEQGEIEVGYGSEWLHIPTGHCVGDIQHTHLHILNIPADAEARVNGDIVDAQYIPKPGDTLEFVLTEPGEKRSAWTEDELVAKYPWVEEAIVRQRLKDYAETHPDLCFSALGSDWYIENRTLWLFLRKVLGPPHREPIPGQTDPALPTSWKRRRQMTKKVANEKAADLARRNRRFVSLSSRDMARRIGCSESLIRQTPFWKSLMERSGRRRELRGVPRLVVSMTPDLERCLGEQDSELQRLIAESEADARSDPSPLDDDLLDKPSRRPRQFRRL